MGEEIIAHVMYVHTYMYMYVVVKELSNGAVGWNIINKMQFSIKGIFDQGDQHFYLSLTQFL